MFWLFPFVDCVFVQRDSGLGDESHKVFPTAKEKPSMSSKGNDDHKTLEEHDPLGSH